MDIKEQLLILSEICRHDHKIIEIKDLIKKLQADFTKANETATLLKGSISALNHKISAEQNKKKLLHEKLDTEKAHLRKWEARAEKIKGERDYTALQSEISAQKRSITQVEAEISQAAEGLKIAENELSKSNKNLEQILEKANTAHESVKERLQIEKENLAKVEHAKNSQLSKLPPSFASRYQKIAEKRANMGIAFVSDETCQECRRKVPPELYNRVIKGEIIEQCPSCLRFLVSSAIGAKNVEV